MNVIYLQSYQLPAGEKKHRYEHRIGLRLLSQGLRDYHQIDLIPKQLEDLLPKAEGRKPFLEGYPQVHFNISHCDGMAACAISGSPVGVDIENPRPISDALIRKVLTKQEREFFAQKVLDQASREAWFFRFWTLKESYLKYTGEGLSRKLNSFSFTFQDRVERRSGADDAWDTAEDAGKIICSEPGTFMHQWTLPDNIILSACCGEDGDCLIRKVNCPGL